MKKGSITRYDQELVLETIVDYDNEEISAWVLEPVKEQIGGGGGGGVTYVVPTQEFNLHDVATLSDVNVSSLSEGDYVLIKITKKTVHDPYTAYLIGEYTVIPLGPTYIIEGYYDPESTSGNSFTITIDSDDGENWNVVITLEGEPVNDLYELTVIAMPI